MVFIIRDSLNWENIYTLGVLEILAIFTVWPICTFCAEIGNRVSIVIKINSK